MAIDRDTLILARPGSGNSLRVHAANFNRSATLTVGAWERSPVEPWTDYIAGVAKEVQSAGHAIPPLDCWILGDVPIGAGLSSSASIEMAALALFEQVAGFSLKHGDAAALGQRVENKFLGLASGIMDQFVSRAAKAGHALFLDCRSHAYRHVELTASEAVFVIADTGISRGLTASKYNERVAQCADAVRVLASTVKSSGTHLRDFSLDDLQSTGAELSDVVYRRARHVITENERTLAACDALHACDSVRFGKLMDESDESLRKDYEVTCPELDAMTAIARDINGCLGSRMTGAGFGGCTVSLVRQDAAPEFCAELQSRYAARTGNHAKIIVSKAADGAGAITL